MTSPEIEGLQEAAIPDFEIESLARHLLPALREFYDSPEGQAAFERWKAEHSKPSQ